MRIKAWGIALAFSAGLGGELAGWGVRFVHPLFAYVKVAMFVLLEGTILALILVVGRALLLSEPSAYTASDFISSIPA